MTPQDRPVVRYTFECHPDADAAMPVVVAGTHAFGLFLLCAVASARSDNCGFITTAMAQKWETDPTLTTLADRLVRAYLWETAPGGWRMVPSDLWRIRAIDRREKISETLRAAVYERDGNVCLRCGDTDDLTLDHVYPWSLGGLDSYDNLQTLCRSCNSIKGARI